MPSSMGNDTIGAAIKISSNSHDSSKLDGVSSNVVGNATGFKYGMQLGNPDPGSTTDSTLHKEPSVVPELIRKIKITPLQTHLFVMTDTIRNAINDELPAKAPQRQRKAGEFFLQLSSQGMRIADDDETPPPNRFPEIRSIAALIKFRSQVCSTCQHECGLSRAIVEDVATLDDERRAAQIRYNRFSTTWMLFGNLISFTERLLFAAQSEKSAEERVKSVTRAFSYLEFVLYVCRVTPTHILLSTDNLKQADLWKAAKKKRFPAPKSKALIDPRKKAFLSSIRAYTDAPRRSSSTAKRTSTTARTPRRWQGRTR